VHRFYAPDLVIGAEVQLPDDESQHLSRVLRLKPGDTIAVFDGKGREALARVETVAARRVTVRVTQPLAGAPNACDPNTAAAFGWPSAAPEPEVAITLAQALLKSDKMDRVIRDAVMLGVAAIQPFVSKRTDVPRAALRSGVRQDRWQRTVIASVKQCGRAVVPRVLETIAFDQLIRSSGDRMKLMFVEPGAGDTNAVPELERPNTNGRVDDMTALEGKRPREAMILIGPEGGWDPQEVEAAAASGAKLVTFGKRTLRADAAGAAAIAVLQYVWKDL
jgi:16S rRNA (uracil1498-N3)-methyltransferase